MPTSSKKTFGQTAQTLDRQAFAAITAVEGLRLSADSQDRLEGLRRSGLSAAERRAAVVAAYAGLGKRR